MENCLDCRREIICHSELYKVYAVAMKHFLPFLRFTGQTSWTNDFGAISEYVDNVVKTLNVKEKKTRKR